MINIDEFIKRLAQILDYYNLSAAAFADKINVQRSSLSHLLSGRNKPSLDFILKVQEVFPEVDLYWILNGVGEFPKSAGSIALKTEEPILHKDKVAADLFASEISNTTEKKSAPVPQEQVAPSAAASTLKNIQQIVIFYEDGTFKNYTP